MQMCTLNVDLSHLDFLPNEACNVSSEVQCPNDKNSPESLAVLLKWGFKGCCPQSHVLCHLYKITAFWSYKGPYNPESYNTASSQCRNFSSRITSRPALKCAIYPRQAIIGPPWGRLVLFQGEPRDCIQCWAPEANVSQQSKVPK